MFKTMMIAGALALGLVVAVPLGPARAGTNVDIGIGLGGGYEPAPHYWPARRGISCGEGRRIVASAGFRRVRAVDCSGREFSYFGLRRDNMYKISVRSFSGRIIDIRRIRRGGGWGGGYDEDDYDGGYGGGGYDDYDDDDY